MDLVTLMANLSAELIYIIIALLLHAMLTVWAEGLLSVLSFKITFCTTRDVKS